MIIIMMVMMYKTSCEPKFVDFCFKELLIINYLEENYTYNLQNTSLILKPWIPFQINCGPSEILSSI